MHPSHRPGVSTYRVARVMPDFGSEVGVEREPARDREPVRLARLLRRDVELAEQPLALGPCQRIEGGGAAVAASRAQLPATRLRPAVARPLAGSR